MNRKMLEEKLIKAGVEIKDGKIRKSDANRILSAKTDLLEIQFGVAGEDKAVGSKAAVMKAAKKNGLSSIEYVKIAYVDSDIDEDAGTAEYFNEVTLRGTKADLVKLLRLGNEDIGNGSDKESIDEIMKDAKPVKGK